MSYSGIITASALQWRHGHVTELTWGLNPLPIFNLLQANGVLMCFREEKTEQLLDCRQELDNMEAEVKRLQQEVRRHLTCLSNKNMFLCDTELR